MMIVDTLDLSRTEQMRKRTRRVRYPTSAVEYLIGQIWEVSRELPVRCGTLQMHQVRERYVFPKDLSKRQRDPPIRRPMQEMRGLYEVCLSAGPDALHP
jgi:hypothetical protein